MDKILIGSLTLLAGLQLTAVPFKDGDRQSGPCVPKLKDAVGDAFVVDYVRVYDRVGGSPVQ